MHKNTSFHIEQTRLNDTYRKLMILVMIFLPINEQENQSLNILVFLN